MGVAPQQLISDIAVSDTAAQTVTAARQAIHNILVEEDDRLLVVVGPCSIHDPDAARALLADAGYPDYNHALGHQIGQSVHDGGAVVGPPWKRYGEMVRMPLEEGSTFTVELGVTLDGIGHVSLEEDLLVTASGGEFLGPQQTELTVI